MTTAHPVVAPPVRVSEPLVIGQRRTALIGSWLGTALWVLWPGLLAERVFGIYGSPWNQLWIVPLGGAAVAVMSRRVPWARPCTATLTVGPRELVYHEGDTSQLIDRTAVGLVDVHGRRSRRQWTVTVLDHHSRSIASWAPLWVGHDPDQVIEVLRAAGYPAGSHHRIYDGGFRRQVDGQPPQAVSLD